VIGLFDRDVFLKLACCDLWSEALDALGVTQPMRLVSTSSMSSNLRILKRWVAADETATIESRLATMIAEVPTISDAMIDEAEETGSIARLSGHDGIDGGEQLLLGILINENQGKVLVTGDKRCVTTFAEVFPKECEKVLSSLISFEKCLCEIEKKYGFELIHKKAHAYRSCDGSLRLAFGETADADHFRAALLSFDPLSPKQAGAVG
jgi:hypothetical protein